MWRFIWWMSIYYKCISVGWAIKEISVKICYTCWKVLWFLIFFWNLLLTIYLFYDFKELRYLWMSSSLFNSIFQVFLYNYIFQTYTLHTHTYTYTHTQIDKYIHTHTHTHIRTHTHTDGTNQDLTSCFGKALFYNLTHCFLYNRCDASL